MSNLTGTYAHLLGQGLVKVSEDVPHLASSVWMPKGDIKYFDKSARRWFESKSDKRQWLEANGMKEGGMIRNPDKRWDGPVKNATKYKPTGEQQRLKKARAAYIQSQGGVNGLLDKFSKQGGSNGKASG